MKERLKTVVRLILLFMHLKRAFNTSHNDDEHLITMFPLDSVYEHDVAHQPSHYLCLCCCRYDDRAPLRLVYLL